MNWRLVGAILAALAVAAGAFGAHALRGRLEPRMLEVYQTGVLYHLVHAVALVAVGRGAGGWLFLAGIVLFSGSLYGLALSGARFFGPITPLGGLCFIAGWIATAVAAAR